MASNAGSAAALVEEVTKRAHAKANLPYEHQPAAEQRPLVPIYIGIDREVPPDVREVTILTSAVAAAHVCSALTLAPLLQCPYSNSCGD